MSVATAACRLSIEASEHQVRLASEWLERACGALNVPADSQYRLDLCLNEALANIIAHGGASARANPVHLTLDAGESRTGRSFATLSLADSGQPFNPLLAAAKPSAPTLADATPGGLGLTMIANYSDQRDYAFRDGRNHLALTVCWDSAGQ